MCICVGCGPCQGFIPVYCWAAFTDTPHHNLPACPIKRSPPVSVIDLEPEAGETAPAFTAHGGNKDDGAIVLMCLDPARRGMPAAPGPIHIRC